MNALQISLSGMDVEWQRLEVIAQNLANVNTVRTAFGEPYRAQRLVSGPALTFEDHLNGVAEQPGPRGVQVYAVAPTEGAPRRVYEPNNPQADANGFVTYPAVDQAGEMTLMVKTSRAYEANLVALGAARQMYAKALELGRVG